jgi:hypothetical protein
MLPIVAPIPLLPTYLLIICSKHLDISYNVQKAIVWRKAKLLRPGSSFFPFADKCKAGILYPYSLDTRFDPRQLPKQGIKKTQSVDVT